MSGRRVLCAAGAALVLLAGHGAGAHEGEGRIEVVAAEPRPMAMRYVVRLTYVVDGHPAEDATMTAVGDGPGGATVGPQPLVPGAEDGLYEVTVEFPEPGTWTVRFTAVTPAATVEDTRAVTAPPGTVAPSTSTTGTTGGEAAATAPADDVSDEDGSSNGVTVAAGAAVVVAAAVAVLAWARRRRATSQRASR